MSDSNEIDDDPMFDMGPEAMEKARDRALQPFLDDIVRYENDRREAGDNIKRTWDKVEAAGYDVRHARRRLLLRLIEAR